MLSDCTECGDFKTCQHLGIGYDSPICRQTRKRCGPWTKLFISMAYLIASKSPDPRTKVGAIITRNDNTIISMGYNGLPRKVNFSVKEITKDIKPLVMVHAEVNAILNAIRNGVSLEGTTLYCTLFPCCICTHAIIQTGIKKVVVDKYGYIRTTEMEFSELMFKQAGVEIIFYEGDIISKIEKTVNKEE